MKAISLFSGMGGDTLGIEDANIQVIAYSELNKIFQKTHDINFPNSVLIGNGDILKTKDSELEVFKNDEDPIDLIFAGFPCQGFSNAGKKLPDDPRNTLFREFLRATKIIKPKFIIGENVKGLLNRKTKENENYIDIIQREFEAIGYKIYYRVMKCNNYGIPQNRHRLIIVGIQSSIVNDNCDFSFPIETNIPVNIKDIVKFYGRHNKS